MNSLHTNRTHKQVSNQQLSSKPHTKNHIDTCSNDSFADFADTGSNNPALGFSFGLHWNIDIDFL